MTSTNVAKNKGLPLLAWSVQAPLYDVNNQQYNYAMTDYKDFKQSHEEFKKSHRLGIEDRTNENGLLWYAQDYYNTYVVVSKEIPIKLLTVKLYLLCHSIELAIKSWLRREGYSVKELVKFDHDLVALIHELIEKFEVKFPKEVVATIALINYYYDTKQLEYFDRGSKTFPDLEYLRYCAELVLHKARTRINEKN